MAVFTSTLPNDLLKQLAERAKQFSLPKNKLMEKALRIYLDQLTKAEYVKSFKQATEDEDTLTIAEEGMADYLSQLDQ
jgi:hypothetical protein